MPDLLIPVLSAAGGAVGAWVAIRVQLAVHEVKIAHINQAVLDVRREVEAAHRRLDNHNVPAAH